MSLERDLKDQMDWSWNDWLDYVREKERHRIKDKKKVEDLIKEINRNEEKE